MDTKYLTEALRNWQNRNADSRTWDQLSPAEQSEIAREAQDLKKKQNVPTGLSPEGRRNRDACERILRGRFVAIVAGALIALGSLAWGQSPGMYVDQAGSLVKMEHVPFAGTGTKGVAKSVFVPGVGPSVVWEFPGVQAPIRVTVRPRFVYHLKPNQTISERDFIIVRMDQKSDHREIRVAKTGAFTLNSRTGYDQKKLAAVTVTRKGDTIEISPAADLDAGEYFITAGLSPVGYDFEVTR
jgi:hypothetical protein